MTRRKPDLVAEGERIAAEYEEAVLVLEAAERDAEVEMRRIAGQQTLHEATEDEARERRLALRADLDSKMERLAVLADAIAEVERRAVEEEQAKRQRERTMAKKALDEALGGRYSAAKGVARAISELTAAVRELQRHRAIVDEKLAAYEAVADGEPISWPNNADELWEIADEIVNVVVAGAITPLLNTARKVEAEEQRQEDDDTAKIAWFAQYPTRTRRELLPEHLQSDPRLAEIEKSWDEKLAKQQAANKKPERGEVVQEERELVDLRRSTQAGRRCSAA